MSVTCPGYKARGLLKITDWHSPAPPTRLAHPIPLPKPSICSGTTSNLKPVLCRSCVCLCQFVQFCHCRSGWTSGGAQKISSHAFVAAIIFATENAKAELDLLI